MSKLTNHQIRAQIEGLEKAVLIDHLHGEQNRSSSRRRLAKLLAYKEELAAREAAGESPGTEIQGQAGNRGTNEHYEAPVKGKLK